MSFSSIARAILRYKPLGSPRPLWPQVCLALFLVLAQTGALLHALEHESTASDASCAVCLNAQHLGDVLSKSPATTAIPSSPGSLVPSTVIVLRAAPRVPFSARAPPVHS